jgi:chromosome segregation ATPase
MPPKKNTSADTMEARIITLEEQFANLEVSLNEAQTRAETLADETKDTMKNLSAELKEQSARAEAEWKDNFNKLLSMMKELQKSNNGAGKSTIYNDAGIGSSIHDSLDEFRLSVKKVELPMFSGEDPTEWIARAEVYFRVQGTNP